MYSAEKNDWRPILRLRFVDLMTSLTSFHDHPKTYIRLIPPSIATDFLDQKAEDSIRQPSSTRSQFPWDFVSPYPPV